MDLELTKIFIRVAQNQSFTRAAEILRLPKSTVSKAVSRLEKTTGTKLILRTTRSLTLTAAGRAFYEACVGPLLQLEDAQKSLSGHDSLLTGLLRITAPEDFGSFVLAPALAELSKRHPDLRFQLIYTDEVLDLVQQGIDLAVRIGPAKSSTYKTKKSGEVVLVPVASPTYIKNHKKIREPRDLLEHPCLSLTTQTGQTRWPLKSSKQSCILAIKPRAASNQMTSLLQMAIFGAGIALVPHYLCRPQLENGSLILVLPDWSSPGMPVSILTPLAPSSSVRLKATVDHISQAITKVL